MRSYYKQVRATSVFALAALLHFSLLGNAIDCVRPTPETSHGVREGNAVGMHEHDSAPAQAPAPGPRLPKCCKLTAPALFRLAGPIQIGVSALHDQDTHVRLFVTMPRSRTTAPEPPPPRA